MNLIRYNKYSREDLHHLSGLTSKFVEGAGKWGLVGIVRVPNTKSDFVFLMTLGTKEGDHSFEEGITKKGVLTWQSQPQQKLHHPQIKNFINHDPVSNTIYLLFRSSTSDKYTYLGDLEYFSHDPTRQEPVHFEWKILDWEIKKSLFKSIGLVLGDASKAQSGSNSEIVKLKKNELLDLGEKPKERKTRSKSENKRKGKTDYVKKAQTSKDTGDAGELLVYNNEVKKLQKLGLGKEVVHESLVNDNAGYDILSYDKNGSPMYIEVKTTEGRINTPFFVSANEVNISAEKLNSYFIYRLYEFDKIKNCAKFYIQEGSLADTFELEAKDYIAYYNG